MYLKRLELQGYKSFAGRTEFAFNGGITAIVGPNGSGKSNIADAIRWVLGEQSYSALRAKRTEDLIFSGSSQRARLGLAEVSLVLDNSAQWLPIDFGEVTITRRAARSGENEYMLNGNRVRLRDIVELLTRAGLGRDASAVIGQGQVDAALSLRPEERRSLFEEAAGVRIYIGKRDETLARLEETHRNLERLNDILSEIAPRLDTLRRQAERTREHDQVKGELEQDLLLWYGYQWQRRQNRLARTVERLAAHSQQVDAQRERIQSLSAERESLRQRQQAIREAITARRQQADQLRARREELRRQLAVAHERSGSLARQQEQLRADLAGVQARREELGAAIARQDQELAALASTIADQQAQLVAAQSELAAAEAAASAQREELERARATAFEVATAQAAARNRLSQLRRRQADLEQEMAQHRAALDDAEGRVAGAADALQAAEDERQLTLTQLGEAEADLRAAEDELAATLTRLDHLRSALASARETHQRLRAQFEVLQRARTQGTYLSQGAQAVIREGMPGVVGTVANLVQPPAELEAAIEAALGGHLQDVVVRTWNDALACIDLLKRRQRGRATFLPLDYVRPRRPIPAPRLPGVLGTASGLVTAAPEFRGVCELLLGSIAIVEDLPAGRRALAAESRLGRAVTLDGDVVEARGVVRGGARPRSRGILAQEREWRELPGQVRAAQQALNGAEAAVRAEDEKQQALRAAARQHAQRLQDCRQALSQHDQKLGALRQRHDRLLQEVSWQRSLEQQAGRARIDTEGELAQVEGQLSAIDSSLAEATAQVEALRARLQGDDLQGLRRRATECETALAVSMRTRQAQEQFIATQREALARAEIEAQTRQEQAEQLQQRSAEAAQRLHDLRSSLATVKQAQQSLAEPLAQLEAELQAAQSRQEASEKEEERARHELQAQLTELNRLTFEREREADALQEIKRQMETELGPVDLPDIGQPRQLRLTLGTGLTPLPTITELPDGLASRLKELRARLRRLGPVNPSAPAEYEEVLQRHTFLTDQVLDLSKAADSTREVITELNRLIRERFSETFAHVAREFSTCFSTLFNGGSARLLLTDPNNPADSGIEIVAQPPGKRSQSLSALSGGERALTAVSLLFALLRVNPLPFCVLDEVDAMLDEANVHRFRTFLEKLSATTQFIIITHNRVTVEAAATVYGISMAREGVSQVLSLALPEATEASTEPVVSAA